VRVTEGRKHECAGPAPRERVRPGRLRRLVTAIAMAAVSAAACLATVATPASAYPGPTTSVFDPRTIGTKFVLDKTDDQWIDIFNQLKNIYVPIDVEVTNIGGIRTSAVFHRQSGISWRLSRHMSLAKFEETNSEAKAAGLRIIDFEAYVKDGVDRYAAIWVESVGTADSEVVMDKQSSQMSSVVAQQRNRGRMPVDVEQYTNNSCTNCYATIWVENVHHLGWNLWWGMSSAAFKAKHDELKSTNRLVAMQSKIHIEDNTWPLPDDAHNTYSAIWTSDTNGRGSGAKRDVDRDQLVSHLTQYSTAGYRPVSVEAYQVKKTCTVGGGCIFTKTYAVTWRQNH